MKATSSKALLVMAQAAGRCDQSEWHGPNARKNAWEAVQDFRAEGYTWIRVRDLEQDSSPEIWSGRF